MNPDVGRVLYLSATASDISTYKRAWLPGWAPGGEATQSGAGASGAGDVLIGAWASDALGMTSLPAGDWTFLLFAMVSSASGSTQIRVRVYTRTAAGTETEIFNVLPFEINDLSAALQTVTYTQATPTDGHGHRPTGGQTVPPDRFGIVDHDHTVPGRGVNQSRALVPFDIPTGNADMFKAVYDPEGDGVLPGSGGGVTSVTGTAPIVSSGGASPAISINAASTGAAGSMSAADKTKLDGVTGTNTGDQTLAGLGGIAHSLATAVNDFLVASGAGAFVKKTLAETVTILRTSLDSVYAPSAKGVTNGDSHDHAGGDGAQIDHTGLSNIGANTHAALDTIVANLNTGWIADSDTWVQVSGTSFKIVGKDVRSRFPVGVKLMCSNPGTKYFYGIGAAMSGSDTLVTVTAGSDNSLVTTITNPYYSYAANPVGFPQWFSHAPSLTNITLGVGGALAASFRISGRSLELDIAITLGSSSTVGTSPYIPLPVTNTKNGVWTAKYKDSGTADYLGTADPAGGLLYFKNVTVSGSFQTYSGISATVPFTWTTNDSLLIHGIYGI